MLLLIAPDMRAIRVIVGEEKLLIFCAITTILL